MAASYSSLAESGGNDPPCPLQAARFQDEGGANYALTLHMDGLGLQLFLCEGDSTRFCFSAAFFKVQG